jgi:hypothetical protein
VTDEEATNRGTALLLQKLDLAFARGAALHTETSLAALRDGIRELDAKAREKGSLNTNEIIALGAACVAVLAGLIKEGQLT